MISDRDTDTIYFSELLKIDSRFSKTFKEVVEILDAVGAKYGFLPDTKDIWARDYMPIQIDDDTFIEYRYDPDYLQGDKKGFRNLKTYSDIVCDSLKLKTKKSDLIMDGGNFVKSKDCVILTCKIIIENKFSYKKRELIAKLQDTFEVEKIVLIPQEESDNYGHSDGMVRFIDNSTVLTQHYYKDYEPIIKPLKRAGLNIEFVDSSVKKAYKQEWVYLNFLQTKDLILLPKLGIEYDNQVFEQIEIFYPEYKGKVYQVDVSESVESGGALNCISWTIKS